MLALRLVAWFDYAHHKLLLAQDKNPQDLLAPSVVEG